MSDREPILDIAYLDHIELLTPRPEESLWFFRDIAGMEEVKRESQSVYLRCYADYQKYSLKLTESKLPGLGKLAWRTMSNPAFLRRSKAIEEMELGIGKTNGDYGIGDTFSFRDPDGHRMDIFYEQEPYEPADALKSALKNQPGKYRGRGIGVKRIDHAALLSGNVAKCRQFMEEALGFTLREQVLFNKGKTEIGSWMGVNNVHHNCAFVTDTRASGGVSGRLHHYGMWVDNREEVLNAADIYRENGIFIEAGPSRHNLSQAFYLYAYEPGGNRVEIYSSSYMVFAPDFKTITWNEAEREGGVYWGSKLPPSFLDYATPPVNFDPARQELAAQIPVFDPL